jgi:hypothetical protein
VGQDFVGPGINELGVVYRDPLERFEGLEVEVPGSLGTAHPRLRKIADRYDFEVVIVDREPGGPVAPLKGFQRLTHKPDVLQRHRPRGISLAPPRLRGHDLHDLVTAGSGISAPLRSDAPTFSCDIAYSRSLAASRASALSR